MTEIRIEKKRSLFPWVLVGLALLAIAIYFFGFRNENNPQEEQESMALISIRENNVTVNEFVQFVGQAQDSAAMSLDHNYTNQAILKLTEAIGAMAGEVNFDVKADMDKAKEHAAIITQDPLETTHADHIRNATDILSTSLQRMQQSKFPELGQEAEQLKAASASIDPKVLTLNQRDAVKGFFNQSADLLKKMN